MAGVFGLTIYPNPAKRSLTIRYGFNPNQTEAALKIYDVTGRLIKAYRVLTNRGTANNRILWAVDDALGRQLSNGINFIQLTAGDQTKTEKVILVR
jgi:hypothetical protein